MVVTPLHQFCELDMRLFSVLLKSFCIILTRFHSFCQCLFGTVAYIVQRFTIYLLNIPKPIQVTANFMFEGAVYELQQEQLPKLISFSVSI